MSSHKPSATRRRICLDQAATSFPKPETVYDAVDHYQRHSGAAIGRGSYRATIEATAIVERCRKRLADLIHARQAEQVIFTFNCTDSLNLALHGALRPEDHVVTSQLEHNSVLRPLRILQHRLQIEVTEVPCQPNGRVDPADVQRALRLHTRLVALLHASNVTGAIQPIAEVGQLAQQAGALMLVDAAQTAGHYPLDVTDLPVDLLAGPGHKGLLGPLGTGFLYVRPGVEEELHSFRQGGTGTQSELDRQPESLPDKYESGNHNAPGLVGLEAGISWVAETGVAALHRHEQQLTARLVEGLRAVNGVTVYGHAAAVEHVGVVSVTVQGFDPQTVAAILDDSFGIEVRAGLHCAPGVHRGLGTIDSGGTVRLSVGPFTTTEDIDAAIAALRDIAASA
jgi:cysteine desulfurase / selenocysteine lyase